MSQVTVTTTTPAMKVVCYGALIKAMTVTIAGALHQNDVVLLPEQIPMDTPRGVVDSAIVLQKQPQSQMLSHAYANYAMGHPQPSFHCQN